MTAAVVIGTVIITAGLAMITIRSTADRGPHVALTQTDPTPTDMDGRAVRFDPGSEPESRASAVPSGMGRFSVPAVGLDVPLGRIDVVRGDITPPDFTSAYVVRGLGTTVEHPDDGTVFVVMHSLRGGGRAPGNYLVDGAGRSTLTRGVQVHLAGLTYAVTGWKIVKKTEIGARADVWSDTPSGLVIITCQQTSDHHPTNDNLVIEATRI